jgi:hypothetical protein
VPRLAILVATCLLAVTACSAGSGSGSTGSGVTSSWDQPSLSPTSAVTTPDPGPDWTNLTEGRLPRVPYVVGNRYVARGGEQPLPPDRRGVSGVVRLDDGLLVSDTVWFEGSNGVDLVRDGRRVEAWPSGAHCSSGSPVGSSDGTYVAWVTVWCPESEDTTVGEVHRASPDLSGEVTEVIGSGLVRVVGFVGERVVYNGGFIGGGWITDFRHAPERIPRVAGVTAVDPRGRLLIARRGNDEADVVVDLDGKVRWRHEAGGLVSFSPHGSLVLAAQGQRGVVLLHAEDGTVADTYDLARGAHAWSTVWESDESLLLLYRHGGREGVVRMSVDGRVEWAAEPLPLRRGIGPYVLLPLP